MIALDDHGARWRRGLLAGLVYTAAGELAASLLPRGRSPLSGLGQTLIDLLPGPSVDIVVATAETRDKALLRGSLATAALGSGLMAAAADRRRPGRGRALLLGQGLVAGAAAASRPESESSSSMLSGAAAGAAGAAALREPAGRRNGSRERVILAAGCGSLAIASLVRARQRRAADRRRSAVALPRAVRPLPPPPPGCELPVPGMTPLFTPSERFYVTDTALTPPRVDPAAWRLHVHGLVEHPLELSLEDLLGMALIEADATLVCVHNPVGGYRVGSARWLGVPLRQLLGRASVRADADQVLTRSIDGFTAGIPLDMVSNDGSFPLVVLGMNGEPLTVRNGFPARLLTPGVWGADASTKWLSSIELTTWDRASDYWDARGWPRVPGAVQPGSRIDVPTDRSVLRGGAAPVAGVAWAPNGGVTGVEVSVDGGPWRSARLSYELSPSLWRQWLLSWQAEPGEHELRARAHSRAGSQQEAPAPPYPRGCSSYHTVRVSVVEGATGPSSARSRRARAQADLGRRLQLAAMAVPAWREHGFPARPTFDERIPPARRRLRDLLPSRP